MLHEIDIAENVYLERDLAPGVKIDVRNEDPADRPMLLYGGSKEPGQDAGKVTKETQTAAYINEARWVVDCPFCSSAQVGSPSDQRFLCCECVNAAVQGAYVPVVYPSDEDRAAIEAAVAIRPLRANVNWEPGETTAVLIAENIENGVMTP